MWDLLWDGSLKKKEKIIYILTNTEINYMVNSVIIIYKQFDFILACLCALISYEIEQK